MANHRRLRPKLIQAIYMETYIQQGLKQYSKVYGESISQLVVHAILQTYPKIKELAAAEPSKVLDI